MSYQFLFFDYETYSLADLKVVGLDNYVKHPSTGISMVAWALDHDDIKLWCPHHGDPPDQLLAALRDPTIIKVAWHAIFEHEITNLIFGPRHVLESLQVAMSEFRDPIVLAHNLSLPGKLEKVAKILEMAELKDERGKELIKLFSQPASVGGELTLFGISPPLFRNHESHPREFLEYSDYCKQDVKAMRDLWYRMSQIPFPERDWQGWLLDQKINSFGIPIRRDLAEKGLRLAVRYITEQRQFLKEKTGLENPNSDIQMKEWATPRGWPWNSLRAPTIRAELNNPNSPITPECRAVLAARIAARRSSYTKLEKILSLVSEDDRLRYQLRYMGAARTGRWASGGGEDASVQVQNFSRGEKAVKKKLELALDLLDREDYDGIVREFTNTKNPKDSIAVVDFVITLLRSLFQAKPGKTFHVVDKNAIENRVLGWVAGCPAITDVFTHSKEDGGDPYLAFAVHLYNKTYAELWANYVAGKEDERQNSKPPVLGGGYGLGGGEMYTNSDGDEVRGGLWGYALSVCGVDMPKELAHKAVKILRAAWPEVVQLWTDLEEAFKQVLKRGGVIKVGEVTWDKHAMEWVEHHTKGKQCVTTFRRIKMGDGRYTIRMELPSGRALHYLNATIEEEQKTFVSQRTGEKVTRPTYTVYYDGIEHSATQGADGKNVKKQHKWGRVKTCGGKLTGNLVQAISRDDLLNSMFLADEMGFDIWGLFHDEIATEVDDSPFGLRLDDLVWCMTQVPDWAPGLMLGAEGYTSKVYKKG